VIPRGWRGTPVATASRMRCLASILCSFVLSLVFWVAFVACIDAPLPDAPPASRIVTTWDPRDCGGSYRVVVELEDDAGVDISASTPCLRGTLTLDAPHFGIYRGRIYAWELAGGSAQIRSVMTVRLAVDEPILRWWVATPR
jgi:hypothetical protein